MRPEVLQLCPLTPALEAGLADRFTVHRGFDDAQRRAALDEAGERIRAVATAGNVGIPAEVAAALPGLEIVAINGVGYDKVDLAEARRRGVRVTNTPDVLTDDVADLAVGLLIALKRQLVLGDRHVREGRWPAGDLGLGRKVAGRRCGILGLGRIGLGIARRLEAFGAIIAYCNRSPRDVPYAYHATPLALAGDCEVLVVAAAASAETRHIIDAAVLAALGPDGVLVNVARGSLVDEAALIAALRDGRLGGAALDVFENEPHVPEALMAFPNVVLTPHMASATRETRQAMADLVLANLDAHFAGAPLPTPVV
ncbi:2-hydroxyacid dehydrogenase [Labrys wisconsinensis]|uniref:Lactate dehydrogenase-like 2-hydroxyacid dehydrogenase n=1 Tax=Labrys wisconsinensis TaxID=425677 RepID=A0ABU0J0S7_9HYPH|nr:2-hydroxyacid dehydrogenase [Labrys wisconsinensis]MDQ0467853.1 lactate dehydrogenase-like 2-hydroxyacid dehydrogenase [Labrys wisconsinensis]